MQRFSHSKFSRLSTRRAFSLVEVTLALGICAFALISVMGVLPVGLDAFQRSKVRTAYAQILQTKLHQVNQTPFSVLVDSSANQSLTQCQFYDEEGLSLPIASGSAAVASLADLTPGDYPSTASRTGIYAARAKVTSGVPLPTPSTPIESAAVVVVEIARLGAPGEVRRFPAHVANLGK